MVVDDEHAAHDSRHGSVEGVRCDQPRRAAIAQAAAAAPRGGPRGRCRADFGDDLDQAANSVDADRPAGVGPGGDQYEALVRGAVCRERIEQPEEVVVEANGSAQPRNRSRDPGRSGEGEGSTDASDGKCEEQVTAVGGEDMSSSRWFQQVRHRAIAYSGSFNLH
jgi:hypothetical protein